MNCDITSLETLLSLQGDLVLVYQHGTEHLLTFIHVVDTGTRSLRLVNRQGKIRKPDWLVSQKLLDAIQPARENDLNARWEVAIR